MNLISFIEQWANPVGYVRVYCESDFWVACHIVYEDNKSWDDISSLMIAEQTFNPKASEYFSFLPKRILKAKVTHFVVTPSREMLIFTNLSKNLK